MAEPNESQSQRSLDYLEQAGKLRPMQERSIAGAERSTFGGSDLSVGLESFAAKAVLEAIRSIEAGKGAGHPGAHLSECARMVGLSGDILIPLSRRLENADLVSTLERDEFGDNLVTLTDRAGKVLDSPDPIAEISNLLPAS